MNGIVGEISRERGMQAIGAVEVGAEHLFRCRSKTCASCGAVQHGVGWLDTACFRCGSWLGERDTHFHLIGTR